MATAPDSAETFRWQGLFQRAREPLFVLNRRRKLLFANTAWETLTQTSLKEARGLICTRRESDQPLGSLRRVLCPPEEVQEGHSVRVRRAIPGKTAGPPWWDIEFLPIRDDACLLAVIGRIQVVAADFPRDGKQIVHSGRQLMPETWAELRQKHISRYSFASWMYDFPSMRRVVSQARLAAQGVTPTVLVGERGTGKRHLARTIHFESDRREQTFVSLDCGHLPQAAIRGFLANFLALNQVGRCGTLLLIGPHLLPLDLQAELVTYLSDQEANYPRLMASFEVDPTTLVRQGQLLEQLFDVVGVLVIQLPSVRAQRGELPRIIDQILVELAGESGKSVATISPTAVDCLAVHEWPGNLTELTEVLTAAVQHAHENPIELADLPWRLRQACSTEAKPASPPTFPGLDAVVEQVERRLIGQALRQAKGNKSKAAEWLAIWRPRLINRMKALGLNDAEP